MIWRFNDRVHYYMVHKQGIIIIFKTNEPWRLKDDEVSVSRISVNIIHNILNCSLNVHTIYVCVKETIYEGKGFRTVKEPN